MKNDPMFPGNFRRNMSDLRAAISNLVHDTIEDSLDAFQSWEFPQRVGAIADYARDEMADYFAEDFPRVDLRDTGDTLVINADLPGVDPDDIEIEVGDDVVAIVGITGYEDEDESEDHDFYSLERYYGTFERVIPLPTLVDPEQALGEIKNGTLTITLPKVDMDELFEFDDDMFFDDADEEVLEMVPAKEKAPKKKKPAAKKPAAKEEAPKKPAAKKPAAKKDKPKENWWSRFFK